MGIAVITDALEKLLLEGAIATLASAPLTSAIVALYQNNVVLTDKSVKTDLSLATFDGYSPVTLGAWRAPYTDLAGDIVVSPSTPAAFSCTGQVTVNTVYGAAILDSSGNTLLAAQAFDTAFSPGTGQAWQITPELSVTGSLNACTC